MLNKAAPWRRCWSQSSTGLAKTLLSAALVAATNIASTGAVERPVPEDFKISDAIADALYRDQGVTGFGIEVGTDDGIVTLSGKTDNLLAKQRAAKIAETMKGVRAVINRVEVKPIQRPDADLIQDVTDALRSHPAANSLQVEVKAEEGKITLSGKADSWQERALAKRIAQGVRGVTAVENQMSVDIAGDRSDAETSADTNSALRWDALVHNGLITVSVVDGAVRLSGRVGSAAEKRRAIADARVPGVESVDATSLDVAYWAPYEHLRRDTYASKSKKEIERTIREALLRDPRVADTHVGLSVDNSTVVLSGVANHLGAKHAAAQVARNKNRGSQKPGVRSRIVARDCRHPSSESDGTMFVIRLADELR